LAARSRTPAHGLHGPDPGRLPCNQRLGPPGLIQPATRSAGVVTANLLRDRRQPDVTAASRHGPSGSSNAATTSYPSPAARSGAAQPTRRSPVTGAIASSTSAISSSVAPAASARPALHSRHTPGEAFATAAAI